MRQHRTLGMADLKNPLDNIRIYVKMLYTRWCIGKHRIFEKLPDAGSAQIFAFRRQMREDTKTVYFFLEKNTL